MMMEIILDFQRPNLLPHLLCFQTRDGISLNLFGKWNVLNFIVKNSRLWTSSQVLWKASRSTCMPMCVFMKFSKLIHCLHVQCVPSLLLKDEGMNCMLDQQIIFHAALNTGSNSNSTKVHAYSAFITGMIEQFLLLQCKELKVCKMELHVAVRIAMQLLCRNSSNLVSAHRGGETRATE